MVDTLSIYKVGTRVVLNDDDLVATLYILSVSTIR
jgi:hypothetical protein